MPDPATETQSSAAYIPLLSIRIAYPAEPGEDIPLSWELTPRQKQTIRQGGNKLVRPPRQSIFQKPLEGPLENGKSLSLDDLFREGGADGLK